MITYEERERMRSRATGRIARWLGITLARDVVRLLDELATSVPEARRSQEWDAAATRYRSMRESLLADLAAAENRARDAEKELAAARSWACHGYEIGQRTATWTDGYRKLPRWLIDSLVPPGADSSLLIEVAMTEPDLKVAGAAMGELQQRILTPPGADPLKESGGITTGVPGRPPQSTGGEL